MYHRERCIIRVCYPFLASRENRKQERERERDKDKERKGI
jgi:hypothetical protein